MLQFLHILFFLSLSFACVSQNTKNMGGDSTYYPLRYLAINVGNASPQFGCWKYKLCREQDVNNLRNYIEFWQPDIIMFSEIYMSGQLNDTMFFGPVLADGYAGVCGESRCRFTNNIVAWDADDASNEHECIAWKTSKLQLIEGSELSVYGRNDEYGQNNCPYDFTGFRVKLLMHSYDTITAVAIHPNSTNANCRTYEIYRYWTQLATGTKTIIGGDFNTDNDAELQVPSDFKIHFSKGHYWDIAHYSNHYSMVAAFGLYNRHLDHAYSNFGNACTDCGHYYGTENLIYGAALGGYNNHPRADNGSGMDHRQILVDMKVPCVTPTASFNYETEDLSVELINTSENSSAVHWCFGDGSSSNEYNTYYTYEQSGIYNICLTVFSACGQDTYCNQVQLASTSVSAVSNNYFSIYPNPTNGIVNISFLDKIERKIIIYDIAGKIVYYSLSNDPFLSIDLSKNKSGIYFIVIEGSNGKCRARISLLRDKK